MLRRPVCRFLSNKAKLELPVHIPTKTAEKSQHLPFHARLVLIDPVKNGMTPIERMYWEVPVKTAGSETELNVPTPDNPWAGLPAPPPHSFSSLDPQDVESERKFMKALEISLPPNDFFRIPVILSKPWFTYVLWFYCFTVALASALFTDWDKLSDGRPHIFTGLQKWWAAKVKDWTTLDEELERKLIKEKLEQAASSK